MAVNDKDHIDVYLNLLPHKWSYAVATSKKLTQCAENQNWNISDTNAGREAPEMFRSGAIAFFNCSKLPFEQFMFFASV